MMLVKRLNRGAKNIAVEALAAAFHEYPVMRYVLLDAGERYDERLNALIGFFCESRLTRDWPLLGVRAGSILAAAAAVNTPGIRPRPPLLEQTYAELTRTIGSEAIARLEQFEAEANRHTPRRPHYYLGMIGVRPEFQGKGLARILMDRVHGMSESDPDSAGVCLSTENPSNVPLYRHFGYEVLGQSAVGGFETWCMFRANRNRRPSLTEDGDQGKR
jgi:GNAT superfamily N-acetyltransferase